MLLRLCIGLLIGATIGTVTGYFGRCRSGACPLTATPFRGAMYGGVLGLLFAMGTATEKGGAGNAAASVAGDPQEQHASKSLVHIGSAEEFASRVLQSDKPCLVDFYSDSCPPCRMLAPTIEELADKYQGRAVVSKANLDGGRNAELAKRYGIRGIPAVLFFQDGKEVERIVGLRDESEYAAVLDRLAPAARADDVTTSQTGAPANSSEQKTKAGTDSL